MRATERGDAAVEIEPRIWSGITDCLPDDHPLAWETLSCSTCGTMVHAANNENMDTWVETGRDVFCLPHFVEAVRSGDQPEGREVFYCFGEGEGWGLKIEPKIDDESHITTAARAGYEQAISTLRDVAQRTGSAAARWAADYLATDPDRRAPA